MSGALRRHQEAPEKAYARELEVVAESTIALGYGRR